MFGVQVGACLLVKVIRQLLWQWRTSLSVTAKPLRRRAWRTRRPALKGQVQAAERARKATHERNARSEEGESDENGGRKWDEERCHESKQMRRFSAYRSAKHSTGVCPRHPQNYSPTRRHFPQVKVPLVDWSTNH